MSMLRYPLVVAPLLFGGCATSFHAGAPPGRVNVVAHRGASAYAPENTLAAFRLAHEMGADWFELDCTLTRDEKLVVIHDGDLERTTNGKGQVIAHSLAELRALDAGTWFDATFAGEKLPSLGECLDFAKERIGIYVEVKSCEDDGRLHGRMIRAIAGHDHMTAALRSEIMGLIKESGTRNLLLTRKAIAAIRERKMHHQTVLQSWSPVVCFVAKTEAPGLRIEFLGSYDDERPKRWDYYLALGHLIDVDGFNVSNDTLTPERLDAFHEAGKSVSVFTVDEPADMKRLATWGVDGIITNKPDVCLGVLEEHGRD